MANPEKITQARVGVFVLLGLVVICAMVVYFGRFGDGLKTYYELRVEYPNASGLFAGADVLLAGAKVGAVKDGPFVLDNMRGVYVILKIYDGVQIPEGSAFTIGSSGLLGDSYVDITMPHDLDVEQYVPIPPGTTVIGRKDSGGLGGLADEGGRMMEDIRGAIQKVDALVTKLNEEVLTKQAIGDVQETLANLKKTSGEFAEASKNLETVMADASTAVKEASEAVKNVSKTVEKTGDTLDTAKRAAAEFEKTMADIRGLIAQARNGKGPIGTLISDRTMAENLQALVVNLRKHGILWYKDRSGMDDERERQQRSR
jgi:ABC-type transport system involved in resistance to organic solvents, periplasmic component